MLAFYPVSDSAPPFVLRNNAAVCKKHILCEVIEGPIMALRLLTESFIRYQLTGRSSHSLSLWFPADIHPPELCRILITSHWHCNILGLAVVVNPLQASSWGQWHDVLTLLDDSLCLPPPESMATRCKAGRYNKGLSHSKTNHITSAVKRFIAI
jgi:hypothetical protein